MSHDLDAALRTVDRAVRHADGERRQVTVARKFIVEMVKESPDLALDAYRLVDRVAHEHKIDPDLVQQAWVYLTRNGLIPASKEEALSSRAG